MRFIERGVQDLHGLSIYLFPFDAERSQVIGSQAGPFGSFGGISRLLKRLAFSFYWRGAYLTIGL